MWVLKWNKITDRKQSKFEKCKNSSSKDECKNATIKKKKVIFPVLKKWTKESTKITERKKWRKAEGRKTSNIASLSKWVIKSNKITEKKRSLKGRKKARSKKEKKQFWKL